MAGSNSRIRTLAQATSVYSCGPPKVAPARQEELQGTPAQARGALAARQVAIRQPILAHVQTGAPAPVVPTQGRPGRTARAPEAKVSAHLGRGVPGAIPARRTDSS
jgi:hypothetical protein